MIFKQKEWYSESQCKENPKSLYIFGDNTLRTGKGGQAQIRDCDNSFGICTKWSPSTVEGAYFIDTINCLEIIEKDIYQLNEIKMSEKYDKIIFPEDGLGSGLSKMPEKCPFLYRRMNRLLATLFDINY